MVMTSSACKMVHRMESNLLVPQNLKCVRIKVASAHGVSN
jgi:hypothetical protein